MAARTNARIKKKLRKTTRFGGAAFAIGLYLAGPQVALAAADTPDDTTSGSAKAAEASGPVRAKAAAPARSARPAPAATVDSVQGPVRAAEAAAVDDGDAVSGAEGPGGASATTRSGRVALSRVTSGSVLPARQNVAQPSGAPQPTPAPASSALVRGAAGVAAATAATPQPNPGAATGAPPATPAAPTPSGSAVSLPALPGFSALPAIPPVLEQIDAQVQSVVVGVFHGLLNIVSTLPVNPVTSWLEGGLLMVRKSLFNQTASVSAIQTANAVQLVTGKIDLVDPEGDGWAIEVVEGPSYGTVVLGQQDQANGIGTTKYTYTPGEGYAGTDSFLIRVTPTDSVFNVFHPFGLLNTRYYTVEVGDAAQAAKTCFGCTDASAKDTLDTTLFLANAGATVSVQKQGLFFPRYQTTVTLSEFAANQSFAWMDIRGRTGTVGVDQMLTEDWAAFADKAGQNAVKPILAFVYTDQGVDKSIFVNVDGVVKNVDGTYQFTGELMESLPAQSDRIDAWDYLGISYNNTFDNFLNSSGLADCASGDVCTTVSTVGILAATTLSPSAYREVGGHDYVLPTPSVSSAYQTSPGSMGPGTTDYNEGNGKSWQGSTGDGDTYLTAMIPWGADGSFLYGTNLAQSSTTNNGVYQYTANAPAGSQPTWAPAPLYGNTWNAAVMAMTAWDQVAVDSNGVMIPASFSGSVNDSQVTIALPNGIDPGMLLGQQVSGTGIPNGAVLDGFVSVSGNNATYTLNQYEDYIGSTTITAPEIPTYLPGLVVGLADGSVQYWNGSGCSQTASGCDSSVQSEASGQGWTQLQAPGGFGAGEPVNTVVSLPNHGFVVGTNNGIYLWNSAVLADGTIIPGAGVSSGCSTSSVGDCWTAIGEGAQVTAIIASGNDGGFVAGYLSGAVYQWDPSSSELVYLGTMTSSVSTLLPYDATTFIGAIGGAPVIVDNGVVSVPSWAPSIDSITASTTTCQSDYNSGSGTGCGGYMLTVQSVAGNPLVVGQQLYGGIGIAPGTTILEQISDGSGNLCSATCEEGGIGVYLVDTSQLVVPGSPMSASNGSGFIVGALDGSVQQWDSVSGQFVQLQDDSWGSPLLTTIPWRDGFVVGLNNGSVFYWSPSNNPAGTNDDNPNALTYLGQDVPTLSTQTGAWSQLQDTGWDNAAIAMVPIGDGFAVGLTAPNSSNNGAVMLYQGLSSTSSSAAWGYAQTAVGPEAVELSNSFTQIADQSDLSGNSPDGSVQQMIPLTGWVTDSSGNLVLGQSLIVGLTNNGIFAWTGSTQNTSTTSWTTLQASGTGGKPTLTADQLQSAWAYGNASSSDTAWGASGGIGDTYVAASGSTPASGDPVFGLSTNQAWCGSSCSSYGDYTPLVFSDQYGTDGSILSFGTTVAVDVDLSSLTYGYIFSPNGVIDKFIPGKYSVGVLVAFQGGPEVTLNMDGSTSATVTENVTGPSESWYEATEVGTFGLTVGLNAGVTAGIDLTNAPSGPVQVAEALFTPGMLYTWNVNGYTKSMSLSNAYYSTVDYITAAEAANYLSEDATLTITPEVTPYISSSYGLFTPPSTPMIGEWTVFDLGAGYQNPISFTLSAPVSDPSNLSMSVSSQGFITATAGFLPDVTSLLTWNGKFQIYSVTDQIMS